MTFVQPQVSYLFIFPDEHTIKEGNFEHFWTCTFFVEYNFIHLKV